MLAELGTAFSSGSVLEEVGVCVVLVTFLSLVLSSTGFVVRGFASVVVTVVLTGLVVVLSITREELVIKLSVEVALILVLVVASLKLVDSISSLSPNGDVVVVDFVRVVDAFVDSSALDCVVLVVVGLLVVVVLVPLSEVCVDVTDDVVDDDLLVSSEFVVVVSDDSSEFTVMVDVIRPLFVSVV